MFRGRAEQPLQPSPQVSRLADIRFRLRIVAAKKKNCRRCRERCEIVSITLRHELEAVGEHEVILEGFGVEAQSRGVRLIGGSQHGALCGSHAR